MITNTELAFWIIAGICAVLFACAIPMIINYLDYKETERRFAR